MTQPVISQANLGLAGQYLNSLSAGDISQRYFNGQQKYSSSALTRFKMFFSISWYLNELKSFYPYQRIISKSLNAYNEQIDSDTQNAVLVTAFSWFTIFNLARRGYVAPILKQYGSFFKTHRLFRHYVYSAVLPYFVLTGLTNRKWLNHTQACWAVHSRRLNSKMTTDPNYTEYPNHLLKPNWKSAWRADYVLPADMPEILANQVSILEAPAYTENSKVFEQIDQKGEEDDEQE